MSGYALDTRVGRVTTGETDTIWYPRTPRAGRYGCVLVHGSGAPTEFIDGVAQRSSVILAAAIAHAGIPCVAGEFGGNAWGNDDVMDGIDSARTLLDATFDIDPAKVCLVAVSMGAGGAARYSQLRPTETACVVGIIPAFDIRYEYENIAATRADIGAAWGVTYPTALPSAADTAANYTPAVRIPLLAGYSTADTVVPSAPVIAYVNSVNGTAIELSTSLDHSDALVGLMDPATVVDFLRTNGA